MTSLLRRSARTLAAASVLPAAFLVPQAVVAAPTVAFTAPAEGGALSGNVQGPPHCIVTGSNIRRVMFYIDGQWTNTDGNLDNGLGCWIDTTKYRDGSYTLTAVAYDSAGATATARRSIVIRNSTASSGPTLSWQAPAEGGTLSGNVQGPPHCIVNGANIARVMFYINGTWTNTDGNLDNGLGCWIDTTKYKDGAYTVRAVAYDAEGRTTEASRSIVIKNSATSPAPSPTGPSLSWKAPAEGGALSGNVQGPPHCIVEGANIRRVMFYLNGQWTNTDGNLDNGLGCWVDTTKYKDGTYTVKAVAYDADGRTAEASRSIVIKNNVAVNNPPNVAITAPQAGATLSGTVNSTTCVAEARDDKAVSKVDFYVGKTLVTSKSAAPYQCAIDTTKFADGSHTLMAVATDSEGATATAQRSVTIKNGGGSDSGGDSGGSIDSGDILGWASGDVAFANQNGYSGQVLGTYPSASSIPEGGIHGSRLPNGETIRLGKSVDPTNSAKKALVFQLHPNDTSTSGSKRAEIKFPKNIEFDKTYWIAFKVYLRDWGSLSSNDHAIFGTQLHSGDNSKGYSPSFSLVTKGGRTFYVETQGTNSSPRRHAEQPIPFGRWIDFVFKVRQSTGSSGILQAWMDGRQIVNYAGPIGYKTAELDYMKFGYYNWSGGFSSARKVMMRSPTIVRDPTGSKYDAATLRAYINK